MRDVDFSDLHVYINIVLPESDEILKALLQSLVMVAQEDIYFLVGTRRSRNQIVIVGQNEQQLDYIVNRVQDELQLNLNILGPQVLYRETIAQTVCRGKELIRPKHP